MHIAFTVTIIQINFLYRVSGEVCYDLAYVRLVMDCKYWFDHLFKFKSKINQLFLPLAHPFSHFKGGDGRTLGGCFGWLRKICWRVFCLAQKSAAHIGTLGGKVVLRKGG